MYNHKFWIYGFVLICLIGISNANTFCYQEFANETTACGGLDTGYYFIVNQLFENPSNTYDGDWETYGSDTGAGAQSGKSSYVFINYSKPTDSINLTWQIESESNLLNISSLDDCFNYYPDIVSFQIELNHNAVEDYTYWACFDGDWNKIQNFTLQAVMYEEAVWWEIEEAPSTEIRTTLSFTKNVKLIFKNIAGRLTFRK